MRSSILLWVIVIPGAVATTVFALFAWKDWVALQAAYQHFEEVVQSSPDTPLLFIAEAKQNIHRINLFAEGVWALLAAIYMAVGLTGLCLQSKRNP